MTHSITLMLICAFLLYPLLTGCTTTRTYTTAAQRTDVPTTIEIESIRTRFPVVLRQLHPPRSPRDRFSALIAPSTDTDNPPDYPTSFEIEGGVVETSEEGSFVYVAGTRPAVKTDNVDVSSDMTIFIVHIMAGVERIYLLEGGPVRIRSQKGIGEPEEKTLVDQFSFVDVAIGPEGQFRIANPKGMPKEGEEDPQGVRAFAIEATKIAAEEWLPIVKIP